MKTFIHKSLLIALCSTAVVACQPTLDLVSVGPGSADFSRYVSIGDGTAGGYADASLNKDAQLVAFPNLLAKQFALLDGAKGFHSAFIQPLVLPLTKGTHTYTSFGFENNKAGTKYDLKYLTLCKGTGSDTIYELYPEMVDSTITTAEISDLFPNAFKVEAPPSGGHYNNLAAQGTKMIYVNAKPGWKHAPSTSSTCDTYWLKMSSTGSSTTGAGAATMLSDAMAQNPTFISINVGAVDVLRFGKSGGFGTAARDPLGTSATPGGDDDMITPVNEFHDSLYSMLNILTGRGTTVPAPASGLLVARPANPANTLKGAIANIIGTESFPYFRYIKYNGLVLDDIKVNELNNIYSAEVAIGQLSFHAGANAYVIGDMAVTNACKCRQIKEDEYILIEILDSLQYCYGTGSKVPLWSRWVLDEGEISTINSYITDYNNILKQAASDFNFAYVDSHANMQPIIKPGGTQYEGITLTNEFVNGNEFSLDGLNISPFGQAASANIWIGAINSKYGASIPGIDATKYPGVIFH
jgi:lysophospholipase L1-like esterase